MKTKRSLLLAALGSLAWVVLAVHADEFPDSWTADRELAQRVDHAVLEGKPMPALDLSDWINGEVKPADLQGKVVLLDLYATWNDSCMKDIPHTNELFKNYKDQGLVIVGVCTSAAGQDKFAANAREHGILYPAARDARQRSAQALHLAHFPTYAVIDRRGIVRLVGLRLQKIEAVVKKLLAEPASVAVGGEPTEPILAQSETDATSGPEPGGTGLKPEELSGLNLARFRERFLNEAVKGGRNFGATPEDIAGWLKECGMAGPKVAAMDGKSLAKFMNKALSGLPGLAAPAQQDEQPEASYEDLGGLDLARFYRRSVEGTKRHGDQAETPATVVRGWLRESGMSDGRAAALGDDGVKELLARVVNTEPRATSVPEQPAGTIVTVDHHGGDAPEADFHFKTVPAPRRSAAVDAKFAVVEGNRDRFGDSVGGLHDGALPGVADQPGANFFFSGAGGRVLADLGKVIPVKEVDTYSWHPDTRAPQIYKLYGSNGDTAGFAAAPKRPRDPAAAGWKLLASVDTRARFGLEGGQYGVSVTNAAGLVGNYRYLLFDVASTETADPFGNTFWSEIAVLDRDAAENPPLEARVPTTPPEGFADLPALGKAQQQLESVAEKALPCIVSLTRLGAGGLQAGSGCVIRHEGLILTAAHVVGAAKTMDVTFPDGKTVRAKALGADYERDVALLQIVEPGDYPFVELGDSTRLVAGDLLVALGHPGGYDPTRTPPVRFGRILGLDHQRYLCSDCAMEEGDSGGPTLNLEGKVVGVHSSIAIEMDGETERAVQSNDAPSEVVQREWVQLLQGERSGDPHATNLTAVDPGELFGLDLSRLQATITQENARHQGIQATPERIAEWLKKAGMDAGKVDGMEPDERGRFWEKLVGNFGKAKPDDGEDGQADASHVAKTAAMVDEQNHLLVAAVRPLLARFQPSVVTLTDGERTVARGTVVRANGFVLTKLSEVIKAGALHARLMDGRDLAATVVTQFPAQDLALVKVAAEGLAPVVFPAGAATLHQGEFLFTPSGGEDSPLAEYGVVSVLERALGGGASLGVLVAEDADGVVLDGVDTDSPATKAGLQKGDHILALNGVAYRHLLEMIPWLKQRVAGEVLNIKYRRGSEEKMMDVTLDALQDGPGEPSAPDAKASKRRDDFPLVFGNDQMLAPSECGSVVVDLSGAVVGVNIARANRVESYALPARVVAELLEKQDFEALQAKAQAASKEVH